jgi:hypothetical protein
LDAGIARKRYVFRGKREPAQVVNWQIIVRTTPGIHVLDEACNMLLIEAPEPIAQGLTVLLVDVCVVEENISYGLSS